MSTAAVVRARFPRAVASFNHYIGGSLRAINKAGHLTRFAVIGGWSIGWALRHYRRETLRLIAQIGMGTGAMAVVGGTAAIVCQPRLGASLRKGSFRMIGTVVGAVVIVLLTAYCPQDRIAYLALLALWCALCAFVATVLRNFASYAAALAGYTAAIIAADVVGDAFEPD